jgi:pimeloyl-ACP methyl ester carboxylesterase
MGLNRVFSTLVIISLLLYMLPVEVGAQVMVDPCELFGCEFPEGKQPVLIVPGIASSHNRQRILKDQLGGSWDFTPTIDWFDPLIERLESEGYVLNEDLFVVHYDWRQSNRLSAIEYLIPAIEQVKEHTGASKVDIIAHSMGGLVARSYIQSANLYQEDVDQVVLLGTPNTGAADGYAVWESGELPDRWGVGERAWILRIERALRKTRDQDLRRPLSFRTFFPSLKELIPINNFITRAGVDIPINNLTEKNTFLSSLRASKNLIAERDIEVISIAGTREQTLHKVGLNTERTREDIALERWRDGHANPDPPLPDSPFGDTTVLVSSATDIGSPTFDLNNVTHEELPEAAQDIIVSKLVENPQGDFVSRRLASKGLGVDVYSPVMPAIHGPNGEVLSIDTNTFANAHFDYNPDDLNDIKMLTILDPPVGNYTIDLAGTGNGEYSIVSSYADDDETVFSERQGNTTVGQHESFTVAIDTDSYVAPAGDIVALLGELNDQVKALVLARHITKSAYGKLYGPVSRAYSFGQSYERHADKHGVDSKQAQKFYLKIQSDFQRFSTELDRQIAAGGLDTMAIQELTTRRNALRDAGL